MTVLFTGTHGAAAAALHGDARFDGPDAPDAVADALEEAGVTPAARAPSGEPVVDTDAWGLPEPVGLCLEEARELVAAIRRRVAELP